MCGIILPTFKKEYLTTHRKKIFGKVQNIYISYTKFKFWSSITGNHFPKCSVNLTNNKYIYPLIGKEILKKIRILKSVLPHSNFIFTQQLVLFYTFLGSNIQIFCIPFQLDVFTFIWSPTY